MTCYAEALAEVSAVGASTGATLAWSGAPAVLQFMPQNSQACWSVQLDPLSWHSFGSATGLLVPGDAGTKMYVTG